MGNNSSMNVSNKLVTDSIDKFLKDVKKTEELRERLKQSQGQISTTLISSLWTIYSTEIFWRNMSLPTSHQFLEDLYGAFDIRLDAAKCEYIMEEYRKQTTNLASPSNSTGIMPLRRPGEKDPVFLIDFNHFKRLFNVAILDIWEQITIEEPPASSRWRKANVKRPSGTSTPMSPASTSNRSSSQDSSSQLDFSAEHFPTRNGDQNVPLPPLWDWIISLRYLPSFNKDEKPPNLLVEDVDFTDRKRMASSLGDLALLPLEVLVDRVLPHIDERSATKLMRCSKATWCLVLQFHKSFIPIRRLEIPEASVEDIILDLQHPKHRALNMLLLEFREGALACEQQLLGIGAVLSPQLKFLTMCIKSSATTATASKTINVTRAHPGWAWPSQFACCLRNLRQLDVAQFNNLLNSYDMSDWLMQVAKECVHLQELHIGAVGDAPVKWTKTLISSKVLHCLFTTAPSLVYISLILASPLLSHNNEEVFDKCNLQHVMATHLFSSDSDTDPWNAHSYPIESLAGLLRRVPKLQSLELIALETYRRQNSLGAPFEIDYHGNERLPQRQPAPLCWRLGESLKLPQLQKLRIRAKFVDEAGHPQQQRKLVALCKELIHNHPNMKNITINPIKCCPPPSKEIDTELRALVKQQTQLDSIVFLWAHFFRPGADRSSSKFYKDQI